MKKKLILLLLATGTFTTGQASATSSACLEDRIAASILLGASISSFTWSTIFATSGKDCNAVEVLRMDAYTLQLKGERTEFLNKFIQRIQREFPQYTEQQIIDDLSGFKFDE